jgi:Protein of unknown function (DUF3300)
MMWQEGRMGRCMAWTVSAILTMALVLGWLEAAAQEAPAAPSDVEAPPPVPAEEAPASDVAEPDVAIEGALSDDELQALVAPIALYPDLVLVLTLQASLAPLDLVMADRFLTQYAEDPSREPDPGWDESVTGLLNYPTVVETMNRDLEWTDTLGSAVIAQLEGVQDAIQEIRGFMRAVGALESNEQMTVIVEVDVIRIEPADENAVFIPQYDPDALLAALYSTDVAPPAEATGAEALEEGVTEPGAIEETAPVETAPAVEAVPAAAPAYYPAVAPPPVSYSSPSPSWLGTAATFAGGAVVGGLVGWAISDDDDDDDDNDGDGDNDGGDGDRYNRGNVDIEDSTIVVNRSDGNGNGDGDDALDDLQRQAQNERLKRDAREKAQREQTKRELEQRYADQQPAQTRGGGERKVAGLSTSGAGQPGAATRSSAGEKQLAARMDEAKTRAQPGGREAARGRSAGSGKAARAGDRKQPQVASAFGGGKSAQQTKRNSDRGLKSRSRAKSEVKPKRGRGGNSAFAQDSDRGGKARGGGHRKKKARGGKR